MRRPEQTVNPDMLECFLEYHCYTGQVHQCLGLARLPLVPAGTVQTLLGAQWGMDEFVHFVVVRHCHTAQRPAANLNPYSLRLEAQLGHHLSRHESVVQSWLVPSAQPQSIPDYDRVEG